MITGEIIAQIGIEKPNILESDVEIDTGKVTYVNLLNENIDNQEVKISSQSEIKNTNKNRYLIRIIELYSDGTFRHFDS